ncbi:MAG: SDR family NAD(P)-dependent oxidoreductase [Pseudomonadota bacterium]
MTTAESRVIMISGANRGIGLATARRLASDGHRLSLGARSPDKIPADTIPGGPHIAPWTAEDKTTSTAWVEEALSRYGRIDGLVMNAGVVLGGDLETGDEEDFDRMWEVNFKGPLRLVRAALPALRKSSHGRVVTVVSLAGKRVLSKEILGYSASKFAALSLSHAIRRAGWNDGVRATAVCPGLVDTDMVADVTAPEGQFKIAPETIADTVAYALGLPNEASVAEILVNSRFEATL